MKRLVFFAIFTISFFFAHAQDLRLTFTSVSDAKFYVYLNGKLQNERSSGMVTLTNLEDKDYHLRIVVDDPFEIALTQTIHPNQKHKDYDVVFNAVKERVYIRYSRQEREIENTGNEEEPAFTQVQPGDTTSHRRHTSIRRDATGDTATQQILKRIRTQTVVE